MNLLKMISSSFSSTRSGSVEPSPVCLDQFMVNGNNNIGVGGFGTVCAAMFVKNHVWYAIKDINKANIMKHKNGVSMIMSELDAMKRTDHPFIVGLHFSFQNKFSVYFCMDMRTGGDLRYYLKKKHIFEEKDVAFYVACLSSALMHIHSKNIIHRDIKPENIILDESGFPHIIDFGVSHVHSIDDHGYWEPTLTSYLASGTKQYLAPEVFSRSHIHGPESDFWSLGVVVYELLYGRRPFDKHCPVQMISYLEKAHHAKKLRDKDLKLKCASGLGVPDGTINTGANLSSLHSAKDRMHPSGSSQRLDHVDLYVSDKNHQHGGHTPHSPLGHQNSAHAGQGTACSTTETTEQHFITSHHDGHVGGHHSGYCTSVGYSHASTASAGHAGIGTPGRVTRPGSSAGGSASGHHLTPASPSSHKSPSHATHLAHAHSNLAFPALSESVEEVAAKDEMENEEDIAAAKAAAAARAAVEAECPTGIYRPAKRNTAGGHQNSLPQLAPLAPGSTPGVSGGADAQHAAGPGGESQASFQSSLPTIDTYGAPQQQQQQLFSSDQPDSSGHTTSGSSAEDIRLQESEYDEPTTVPGDHWLVDEGSLPKHLVVAMPTGTAWLGTISSLCITMLGGLFEMRPSHRLGCGTHRGRLQHHPWLAMYGYSDWDSMHQLRIKPAFRPGKRFMEEQFSEGAGEKGKEKERHLVPNPGEAPALSKEQQHEFRHFDYIRPQHDELFLPVHNPASPVHTQRSISEMFSSTIAKTLKGSASPKASPVR